jgi:multidrug efflux pump subunit AcrA (membrane-fusion protein)
MKRKAILSVIVLALLVASGVFWGRGCTPDKQASGQTAATKSAPKVRVVSASRGTIAQLLETTGEIVAPKSVVIASVAEGPISFCPWREGDRVAEGEKLLEIDRDVHRAEVQTAQAAVAMAQAKLADLQSGTRPEEIAKAEETVKQLEESAAFSGVNLERMATLVKTGALSSETLEKAQVEHVTQQTRLVSARAHLAMLKAGPTGTELAVQRAILDEAGARLDLARARMAESLILAPFTGTITRVHVRPGSLAVAKAPLLELADLSSLVVRFAVPEIHAAAVQLDMGLEFLPDAHPGKVFQGHVVRIYPDLDQRMRTRTVEAGIAAGAELIPGMFGRLKLSLRIAEETVVLPSGAVTATPQGMAAVFVVEEGKARRQIVTTGIEADNRVQILSGVQPGDTIVVAGHEKLKDGASVRVEGEDRQDQGKNTKSTGQSTAMEPKAGGGDQ